MLSYLLATLAKPCVWEPKPPHPNPHAGPGLQCCHAGWTWGAWAADWQVDKDGTGLQLLQPGGPRVRGRDELEEPGGHSLARGLRDLAVLARCRGRAPARSAPCRAAFFI